MSAFKFKLTSDLIANTLCALTIGTGIAEYTFNVITPEKKVKYFKEAYKYVH